MQVSRAILGDKKPLTTRPSAALPPADFAKVKAELQSEIGDVLGEVTDELVVSSLLYPKVSNGEHALSIALPPTKLYLTIKYSAQYGDLVLICRLRRV